MLTVISYHVGAPTLTSPKYSFDESPICMYAETVTVTNLPSFVIHNLATADFTIPQTFDLALIGEYKLRIRSEISIPNDSTSTTFTKKFAEYDFLVRMEPCVVDSYSSTKTVSVIDYNIGAPALTSGSYSFA